MLNWWWLNNSYFFFGFYQELLYSKSAKLYVQYSLIYVVSVLFLFTFCKKNTQVSASQFALVLPTVWLFYTSKQPLNAGLFNTLAFYHPSCLFVSFLCILYWFLFKKLYLFVSLLAGVLFIVLGSWWSSQELLWLGWWNWDGVENTIVNYIVFTILFTHVLVKRSYFHVQKNILICFIFLFFFYLNKTNIFKSIHSFTNSTVNNLSYVYVIYSIVVLIALLTHLKYFPLPLYFFFVWFSFFVFLGFYKNIVFFNLKFLFYVNFIFYMYYLIFINAAMLHIVLWLPNFNVAFFVISATIINSKYPKNFKILHAVVLTLVYFFWSCLADQTFSFFTNSLWYESDSIQILFLNQKIVVTRGLMAVEQSLKTASILPIYKNISMSSNQVFLELVSTTINTAKNFKFGPNFLIIFFFLVTEVIYLNQKPRYNYYRIMYHFKSDLLVNQQKLRRIPQRIQKNHWGTEHFQTKKIKFFLLKNQLTVDLRFYKLILRKLKKKLLKLKAKVYIYLIPNNKTSHKSKNSRMGKGKGMNNRFYFRSKKTKPVIIFNNFSIFRYYKLKRFLLKHFDYKYV